MAPEESYVEHFTRGPSKRDPIPTPFYHAPLESNVFQIAPRVVTTRFVIPDYWNAASPTSKGGKFDPKDLGLLVDKTLTELGLTVGEVDGVISSSYRYSQSGLLTLWARHYFEKSNGRELPYFTWEKEKQEWHDPPKARIVPGAGYLIFTPNVISGRTFDTSVIDYLREHEAKPLAICALVERRTRQTRIKSVPVISLADFSGDTFGVKDPRAKGKTVQDFYNIF